MELIKEVLLGVANLLAKEWQDKDVSFIRNDYEKLKLLVSINKLVSNQQINLSEIEDEAPAFCNLYKRVMLRELAEVIESGDDTRRTH